MYEVMVENSAYRAIKFATYGTMNFIIQNQRGANVRNCENAAKRKLRRRKPMPVCRECGKNVNKLNYKGIPVCLQHYNELKKKDAGIWKVKTPKPVVPKAVHNV